MVILLLVSAIGNIEFGFKTSEVALKNVPSYCYYVSKLLILQETENLKQAVDPDTTPERCLKVNADYSKKLTVKLRFKYWLLISIL